MINKFNFFSTAEVDFDGRKLTKNYLDRIDIEALFAELKNVQTLTECQDFMLKHGENIVDLLGAEVDRIEGELKVIVVVVGFHI